MISKLAVKFAVGTAYNTEYVTGIWTIDFDGTAENFLAGINSCFQQACRLYAENSKGVATQSPDGGFHYLDGLCVAVKDFTILYREDVK